MTLIFSEHAMATENNCQGIDVLQDSLDHFHKYRKYKKALQLFEENKNVFLQNPGSAALAFKTIGNCYLEQGDIQIAEGIFNKALNYNQQTGHDADFLVRIYANLGKTHLLQSAYDSALFYYQQAFAELQQQDQNLFPELFIHLGLVYRYLNKIDSAVYYYTVGRDSLLKKYGRYSKPMYTLLYGLSNIYYYKGEYNKASEIQLECLHIINEDDENFFTQNDLQAMYRNLSLSYAKLGKHRKAIYYALASSNALSGKDSRTKHSILYGEIATNYRRLGQADSAECFYMKAIDILKDRDTFARALSYQRYGNFLLTEKKQFDKSNEYYLRAKKLFEKKYGTLKPELVDINTCLGVVAEKKSQYKKALYYYQMALKCIDNSLNENDYAANINPLYAETMQVLKIVMRKIRTLNLIFTENTADKSKIAGQILTNLDYYTSSFNAMIMDNTLMTDQINFIRKDLKSQIKKGIHAAYYLYRQTGNPMYFNTGFTLSEKARSLILKAIFYKQVMAGQVSEETAALEKQLRKDIHTINFLLKQESTQQINNEHERDSLRSLLVFLMQRQDSLIASIKNTGDGYTGINYAIAPGYREIQNGLGHDQVLIEYFLQDTSLFAFLIAKDTVQWTYRFVDSSFKQSLLTLPEITNPLSKFHSSPDDFANISYFLYQYLIGAVFDISEKKNIMIVPDAELCFLPFEILLTKKPKGDAIYRELPYLIKSHCISYYYSVAFLNDINSRHGNNHKFAAIIPDYNKNIDSISLSEDQLTPIIKAKEEADRIAGMLHGDLINPSQMQMDEFEKKIVRFGLLHFTAHTKIEDQQPLNSRLIFADCSSDSVGVCKLTAMQICNLSLRSRMAVLSSCNTGIGKILSGEGIMSLAWAFRYAGCPSIIMTLKAVDDNSTKAIMINYYKNLKDGMKKDEALRQAKLRYLEQALPSKTNPVYWACIISVGEQSPVFYGTKYYYWIGAICLGVLLFITLLRKRLFTVKKIK